MLALLCTKNIFLQKLCTYSKNPSWNHWQAKSELNPIKPYKTETCFALFSAAFFVQVIEKWFKNWNSDYVQKWSRVEQGGNHYQWLYQIAGLEDESHYCSLSCVRPRQGITNWNHIGEPWRANHRERDRERPWTRATDAVSYAKALILPSSTVTSSSLGRTVATQTLARESHSSHQVHLVPRSVLESKYHFWKVRLQPCRYVKTHEWLNVFSIRHHIHFELTRIISLDVYNMLSNFSYRSSLRDCKN